MKICFLKRIFALGAAVVGLGYLAVFGGVVSNWSDEQFGESYELQDGDDTWTVFVYKVAGSQWTFNLPEGATKFEALVVGAGGGGGGGWDKDGGDGVEGCDGGSGVVMLRWCVSSGDPLIIIIK